jgi:periplasmic divalent cation tolerance protein
MASLHSVSVTGPNESVLAEIAHTLLREQLIASANIIPAIRSVFRWNDEVHDISEALAFLQTTRACIPRLIERVAELHPYQTPHIFSHPFDLAHLGYSQWVIDQTAP